MPEKRNHDDVIETMYKYRYEIDKRRNVCVFEIMKDTHVDPFTILIFKFKEVGFLPIFSDLFYSKHWDERRGKDGKVSSDIQFLINLWRELGMVEKIGSEYKPEHMIEHDLERYPSVYRRSLEDVMNRKFGSREITVVEDTSIPVNECSRKSKLVKLNFDISDTDLEIEHKIKEGILNSINE
jgi:hypothetical protein